MKKTHIYLLLAMVGLLLNACTYDFIVKEELPPVDPTVQITFSTQIAPIFNTEACVACHKPGGQAPDLTSANAYNSLKNMNLFNATTPASSIIYTEPLKANAVVHSWKKFSDAEAQLVLTWIQQGAKNN